MIRIELEGRKLRDDCHDYLMEAFEFPEYYGRNLDALYDCLCDISKDITIVIDDPDQADESVLETIYDGASDNSEYITISIVE